MNGAQLRMARAALKMSVRDLAAAASVSPNTITRIEADLPSNSSTVAAVRSALESSGIEFTNGGQPGVRINARPSVEVLDQKIAEVRKRMPAVDYAAEPSPEKGMRLLRRAKAKNDLVKLKNRRTKLTNAKKK